MGKSRVHLENDHLKWQKNYEYEKDQILQAIGLKTLGIEHIGSTSIKGMAAKPIIDIMVGVLDLADYFMFLRPLSSIDFEYVHKPELTERKFFRKGEWGKGTCHLHMCEYGSREWNEKILFRNYLQAHPAAAEKYATLKKQLASKYQFDRPAYTREKEPFIKTVIERAMREIQQQ
ncbi:GrpB family protein [Mesobacillus foraminis]|uniref:GrpB family protein n=1 Tax=Mesobacillus foraminis TaxID=279826 RepID=UPI001BEA286A|nr:GrpB family protein [Mesobacillus foraminis]MBT2759152.1 GrpB family protein [Mesobacillus foraminis]